MISSDHVTIVAPAPAHDEIVHPLACFHRKWRVDQTAASQARQDAEAALLATLTEAQHRLYQDLDAAIGWESVASVDLVIEGLGTHFPGLAPAIRAVAYHVEDQTADACCREAATDAIS